MFNLDRMINKLMCAMNLKNVAHVLLDCFVTTIKSSRGSTRQYKSYHKNQSSDRKRISLF